MINESPPAKPAFHEDVAELLYGNALAGILVTLLASSLLVFGFPSPELQTYKLSWWAIISALMVIRLVDVFYWRKRKTQQNYNSKKAVSRFVTGTFASSIMWSIFCLYNSQYATSTELACMIIIVSALAGGAATVLAAHKITAMTYSLIMLGPFSLSLLLSNEQYQQVLGSLGLAFSLVMMITAKKSADFTTNAIHLKNDNAALVNQMEQKVARRTAKIYQLSNLDPLTGLFNRSAFIHHLQKQLAVSQENDIPIALLFIDLDGFKKINDSLGHETGDKVLKLTARRLEKFCDEQHLLCRWGGDEFLIASIGANQQTADKDAKKVIDAISEYYDFESNRLSIGATIGIALYPEHASTSNELIQLADTAMYYQKKKQPRSVGLFNQEMGERLFREQRLKTALGEAINQRQLRVVYQPIVDARTHEVIAFEALLRWNLDGENVPPDEFINLAEQYGLINSIGNWVLQQSCIAASQWIEANTAIQPLVSVNVSVLQLHNANFIEIVRSALSNAQLDPEKLTIEITESIFSDDKEIIFQRIKQLQSMGIKVSIDDFGTKYSSLSVIQDLAVNTVKIDRSFVNKLSSNGMAIIEAVNQMASSLNYEVIAEGVETQQQVQILSDLGIEMLQGYYFSKPLERDKVIPYINQHLS